jgi:hypothetical protein
VPATNPVVAGCLARKPFLGLYFEIPSPEMISKAIQFLARPQTKGEENEGKLDLGEARGTPVALDRDDEYTDRCFLVVGPNDSPIVRLAVAGEDWHNLVQALRQVEQDLFQSPGRGTPGGGSPEDIPATSRSQPGDGSSQ